MNRHYTILSLIVINIIIAIIIDLDMKQAKYAIIYSLLLCTIYVVSVYKRILSITVCKNACCSTILT